MQMGIRREREGKNRRGTLPDYGLQLIPNM